MYNLLVKNEIRKETVSCGSGELRKIEKEVGKYIFDEIDEIFQVLAKPTVIKNDHSKNSVRYRGILLKKDDGIPNNKQLLDEVFVICRIINVEVRVISQAEGEADNSFETLTILHITKTESNNCFIIHFQRKKLKNRMP